MRSHPSHNTIRFQSVAMAEEAQICTRCASVVPEVLAKPCARWADDQAVEMTAEQVRQALVLAAKVRRLEELARHPDFDLAVLSYDLGEAEAAGEPTLDSLLAVFEAAVEGGGDET